jgi:hypothetical protein
MRKEHIVTTIAFLLAAGLFVPAAAFQVRELAWADLVQKVEFEDPFEALPPDQLLDLSLVVRAREQEASGREIGEEARKRWEAATMRLEKAGVDIDGLLAKKAEIAELRRQRAYAVVESLNGQQVHMPGYVLPLEYHGTQIAEFLLVPWVGACIHTPPPPPNQIVYVKMEKAVEIRGGFMPVGGFIPVWVTGEMTVKAATKNLYLVDGSADIDVGYSLQASHVEPYKTH